MDMIWYIWCCLQFVNAKIPFIIIISAIKRARVYVHPPFSNTQQYQIKLVIHLSICRYILYAYTYISIYKYDRRTFRSQTSDNIDRWKAEQGRGREKRKIRRKKSRRERVRRKKMHMREKVGKSRNTLFFPMICGSGGSKSRLAKAAGAEPAGQMRDEKLHAVVARSTFASQNVQNTPRSDHFWELWCRKSARRCGAKHISKWKCTKHTMVGPLLEVEMSKKCTPLWREAHFQVKMYKTQHGRTTFGSWDVEKVHRMAGARDCGPCQKWAKHEGFVAFSITSTTTLHYTPIHYTTLQLQLQLHLHYILLHYTTLRYTTLHSITLNYTTLHYTTVHYTTPHYTT